MIKINHLIGAIAVAATLSACQPQTQQTVATTEPTFVTVKDGHFERDGAPYYFVGANFWYGAILGSEGQGGNRERLAAELDTLKALGVTNLRILVGSDGERGVKTKVEPTLQIAPNVYNDTILAGLDYLLKEMGDRDMTAVLYLNNSWEWSGGYGFYLEHAGVGKAPRPNEDGYPAFMTFVSQYANNDKAHELFYDYVRFIIGRTNQYTGKKYVDDTAIMSWQIGNEPRAFSDDAKEPFAAWLSEASALIKSLDANHLVSIGTEGAWGCENDYALYEKISSDKNVDYMNIHIWPYNWGWAKADNLEGDFENACSETKKYIDASLEVASRLNKPVTMEEFGFPRDGFSFSTESSTNTRDKYYTFVFDIVSQAAAERTNFAGCNFWAWGGFAKPAHEDWQVGDDYTGDPAQEAQGLNSVFCSDSSTVAIIKAANDKIAESLNASLKK